jgi:hypothetical protein
VSVLREIAARFGISFDDEPLKRGAVSIQANVRALRALGETLAGSAIVLGVRSFVEDMEATGSALNDASDRLGVTARDLQELQLAAGQAGVRAEQLNNALAGLSSRAEQARAGTGPAADAFRILGVRATDAHDQVRPVSDLMNDIAAGMSRIQDPAQRVRLSMQLFGGVGRRLVGVLHEGAGGLTEMRTQLDALGGGMSDEAVHAADDYGDALGRQRVAMLSLKSQIANVLLPILTRFTDWLSHSFAAITRVTRGTEVFRLSMAALSVVAAVQLWPTILRLGQSFWALARAQGAAFIGIALAVLVIDDLMALFRGGNSLIGTFVDRMFGLGTSARLVRSLREAWEGVQLAIHDAGQQLGIFWDSITFAASAAWNAISDGFARAWHAIDNALGGALTRMGQRFERWFGPIRSALERVGILDRAPASTGSTDGARSGGNTAVAGGGLNSNSGILDTWASILGQTGGDEASHANRNIRREVKNTNHVQVHAPITVNGAQSPQATGAAVSAAINGHVAASADAAMPRPQRE